MCTDRQYIQLLGGPTAVANRFGYSVQRVSNWGSRGIPSDVLLNDKDLAFALREIGYVRLVDTQ